MVLLVDIGNSAIKWATSRDLISINDSDSAHYMRSQFAEILGSKWQHMPTPQRLLVSNVAGQEIADALTHWSQKYWQITPEFVRVENNRCGIKHAYEDISQLGVDRWLAIIAAWKKYNNALCVVDCGTAITIDGVSETGHHLGGMILPGIQLMQQSLLERAQGISKIKNIQGQPELAQNTQQGIASGTTMAVVSLINQIVNDMQRKYGNKVTCVISGGGAQQVLQLLASDFNYEPDLVLQGLVYLAKKNS